MSIRLHVRVVRLLSPAVACAVLAWIFLVLAPLPAFELRGGYVATGLLLLFGELVTSILLVASIDDVSVPPRAWERWRMLDRQFERISDIGQRYPAIGDAVRAASTEVGLLTLMVGFGLTASLGIVAIGWFGIGLVGVGSLSSSELALGLFVLVTAAVIMVWRTSGYSGWVIGSCAAGLASQWRLSPQIYRDEGSAFLELESVLGWLGLMAFLLAIGYVYRRRPTIRRVPSSAV